MYYGEAEVIPFFIESIEQSLYSNVELKVTLIGFSYHEEAIEWIPSHKNKKQVN